MKFKLLAITLFSASTLMACSSNNVEVSECVFPDGSNEDAPSWVCDYPVEGYGLTAVGVAPKSQAGFDFMKDIASNNARVKLAKIYQTRVDGLVDQYIGTTGNGESETVDVVRSSVSKSITSQSLVGSKLIKSTVGPNGDLYVLMTMDESIVKPQIKNTINNSMNNENALWQEFKAKNGHEKLDQAVDSLFEKQ